jgi:anionic cell wall polymer biosynthesis LytR-Cps2A-Psr (LCP) family protein
LKETVELTLGLEIHKYIKVYFEGFEKVIDHIGGIWIHNPYPIIDKRYPSKDYKYETFELGEGYQNLDGATALKFARTRHGDSDFSRAARQQEVINGVYNAIKKLDFTNIDLILKIVKELNNFITTDIGVFDAMKYLSKYKDYKLKAGNVLKSPEHLYSARNYYGQYIVRPRDPSLMHIHNYIEEIIK